MINRPRHKSDNMLCWSRTRCRCCSEIQDEFGYNQCSVQHAEITEGSVFSAVQLVLIVYLKSGSAHNKLLSNHALKQRYHMTYPVHTWFNTLLQDDVQCRYVLLVLPHVRYNVQSAIMSTFPNTPTLFRSSAAFCRCCAASTVLAATARSSSATAATACATLSCGTSTVRSMRLPLRTANRRRSCGGWQANTGHTFVIVDC